MTTFYLVRHGSNDFYLHTLVGRKPGVRLNETGREESHALAERLVSEKIQRIFTSPLERCRETAEPIASRSGLELRTVDALNEVDFGEWTGKTFTELDKMDSWKQWNLFRSGARVPGGESMFEVQTRMVGLIDQLRREFPDQRIALVSHGDPLRALLLHFLGSPTEFIRRLELSPGSVSVMTISDWEVQVRCLNVRCGSEGSQLL